MLPRSGGQEGAVLIRVDRSQRLSAGRVDGHDQGHDPVDPLDALLLRRLPVVRRVRLDAHVARHRSAHEAIQHLSCSGDDCAILVDGMYLSLTKAEAERLEAAAIPFAYLFDRDGQIMTVPVGDD